MRLVGEERKQRCCASLLFFLVLCSCCCSFSPSSSFVLVPEVMMILLDHPSSSVLCAVCGVLMNLAAEPNHHAIFHEQNAFTKYDDDDHDDDDGHPSLPRLVSSRFSFSLSLSSRSRDSISVNWLIAWVASPRRSASREWIGVSETELSVAASPFRDITVLPSLRPYKQFLEAALCCLWQWSRRWDISNEAPRITRNEAFLLWTSLSLCCVLRALRV